MILNLRRFLKKLDNPLDNDELLKETIKAYANENSRYVSFYNIEDKTSNIDEESENEFELYVFNKWKNSMLESLKSYNDDIIRNVGRDEFLIKDSLIRILTNFNPKNQGELYDFFHKNTDHFTIAGEKYLNFIMDNIYSINNDKNGRNFSSRIINQKKENKIEAKHKLSINVDTKYLYKFALLFIKKCDELNIPYDFNFVDLMNITNQFEINSDTEHLYKYIQVLEKLKEEHKEEFEANIKKPSILSSHIDNWIGYISNTSKVVDDTKQRTLMFNYILDKVNKSFTKLFAKEGIVIDNKRISYKSFLSDVLYKELLKELHKEIKNTKSEEKSRITEEDLNNPEVHIVIKDMISKNMDYIMNNITDLDKLDESKLFSINSKVEDSPIEITKHLISKALRQQLNIIAPREKSFIDQYRKRIKIESEKFGLLPENISLDNKAFEELLEKDSKDKKELHERLLKYRH